MPGYTTGLILAVLALVSRGEASALIRGDVGNKPVPDPGWPAGAAVLFNHPGRAAWWEGPPFGGGQWHAECRGDAQALNAVLANFAKLDAKVKRVVVHDGTGYSFWLAPNREPEKLAAAKVDWIFMVWETPNWERLRNMPADLNPTDSGDTSPPSQIDVYTAGLRWADVTVPEGITVDDQRLEAHGFTIADGLVIEGKVTDLATGQPLTATMRLERVEPQKTGGYAYPLVAQTKADDQGRWVLKHVPAGWVRVVVEAAGFVPRVAGYGQFDVEPRWQSFNTNIALAVAVAGRITDEAGQPLAGVDVRLDNVQAKSGGRYESPAGYTVKSDANGHFRVEQVPEGPATVWIHKPGYTRPGLGLPITTPKDDVELRMMHSASLRVTVDFTGKPRPEGYIVQIAPEGGEAVGSYGGSGNINAQQQIAFENVPPGRYVLHGRPNPGSDDQQTEAVTVDLKGGQALEVTLKAK
jgi:hypothetical protein